MATTTWTGALNPNEIFASLYNVIIGQSVYSKNIGSSFTSLVDRARIDGSLFGDTYLYFATDILGVNDFIPDSETARNVLANHRPPEPHVQAIQLDVFKQIAVTIDSYFSKRAFSTPSVFADFNSTLLAWLRDTKRVYEQTTYLTYVGTAESDLGKQEQTVSLGEDDSLNARLIAEKVADVLVDMKNVGTDYNDLGYMRAYDPEDLIVVWNSKYANSIKKLGLPVIFDNAGLMDKFDEANIVPANYFGKINTANGEATTATRWAKATTTSDGKTHYAGFEFGTGSYKANETYEEDDTIICKIIHKDSIPFMSGFETESVFINARNANSENHYLTFAHNTLQYLENYPIVTIRAEKV